MNEDTGVHYVTPWEIGKEIGGFIGVGQVIKSSDPAFSPGDIVEALLRLHGPGLHFSNANKRNKIHSER